MKRSRHIPLPVFLALLLTATALPAEEPGFFLLPESGQGELVRFLTSPLLDRSVLTEIAARAEKTAREKLMDRRNQLAGVCTSGGRDEALALVARDHEAYLVRQKAVEDHTLRRIETEIEPTLREEAMRLRKIAFEMQRERQRIVRKSWVDMLSGDCNPDGLFPEKLMLPYYLALFQYQSIFPPEKRFASLLLPGEGR